MSTITPTPAPDFGHDHAPRKPVLWKWSLAAAAAILLVLMWRCGSALYEGRALSNKAVWHFHTQLNDGQFEGICSEADSAFSQSENRDDFLRFLEGVHRKLGDAGEEKLTNIWANVTTKGTFLTVEYTTTFAQGQAKEVFTWRRDGATLKLYRYDIQSPVFLK